MNDKQEYENTPDAKLLEYCRSAEAAIKAGLSPNAIRFRGGTDSFKGADLGNAILHEFWLLLCTNDRRYSDVRSKSKRVTAGGLAAISAYSAGAFGLETAAATAAVSALAVLVQRVGMAALCSVWKPGGERQNQVKR